MSRDSDERIQEGRRAFLRGRFFTSRTRPDRPDPRGPMGLPPPVGLALRAQGNVCATCDAPCVDSCEPAVIGRHPDGHLLAGVPFLLFDKNGCTFCGECIRACPAETADGPHASRLGLAVLAQDACIAWGGAVCMNCQVSCTYQAVRMDDRRRPSIDPVACTGCGFCIAACPTRAIRIGPALR